MNKLVMILGAGLMQGPAIQAAKELGYKTVVVDGNPHAVCAKDADIFEPIDLKDRQALAEYAKSLKNNGNELCAVFTAGTDFSASVAYVAQECGLRSHSFESCLNASDKIRMRSCFKKYGVPSPGFVEISSSQIAGMTSMAETGVLEFPKVIKPVDNMGGRGCRLIRNKSEFQSAVTEAVLNSRSNRAIFEDYMEGAEFSIDSIVKDGTVTITGFADRHIFYPPYFIEMGHSLPSKVDAKIKNELIATFALGIKALGLTCGVAKADIKYTKNGPMIGEIAARLSGGYMSGWTYPYASDCYLTKEAMKVALGLESDYLEKNRVKLEWQPHESVKDKEKPFELYELKTKRYCAERAWLSIPGKIKSITGYAAAASIEGVKDVLPRVKEGDTVTFPHNNVEKCGNVISVLHERDLSYTSAHKAVSLITIRLEKDNEETTAFLEGVRAEDEKGFPPLAFAISNEIKSKLDLKSYPIKKGEKALDHIPESLIQFKDTLEDFNHCTMSFALQKFDELCADHADIDGGIFWKYFLRGSVQGALYAADCLKSCKE